MEGDQAMAGIRQPQRDDAWSAPHRAVRGLAIQGVEGHHASHQPHHEHTKGAVFSIEPPRSPAPIMTDGSATGAVLPPPPVASFGLAMNSLCDRRDALQYGTSPATDSAASMMPSSHAPHGAGAASVPPSLGGGAVMFGTSMAAGMPAPAVLSSMSSMPVEAGRAAAATEVRPLPAASVSSFGLPVDAGMPPRADQDEDIPKSRVREGRWTEKEHALFLEGYKVYGKSWKDLSRYIGSRTPEQIRTHAQKYFAKHEKPRRSSFDSTKRVKLDSYDAQSSLPSLNPLPTHQDLRLARSPVFRSQSGNLLGGGGSRPRSSSFDVSYQRPRAESVCSTADSESTGPFHNHALSILIRELEEQHNSTVKEEDDDDDDEEYDDDYSFDDSGDGSSSGRRRKRASAVGWKNRYSGTEWAEAAEERGDDEDEGFDDVEDDDSMDENIIVGFSSRPVADEQDDESIEETFGRRSGPAAGSAYGRRPPTGRRSEDMEDDDDEEYRLGEDEGAPRKRSGSSAGSKAGGAVRIREGRWSREEHALFLRAYKRYGKAWKEISRIVVTRTPEQIRTHAQKYFQKQNRHRTAGGAAGSARGGASKASGDDNMSVDADEDEAQQEDAEGMMPGSTKSFSRASRPRRSSVSSVGSITDSVPSSTNNATRGKASSAPSTSRSASSSPLTQGLSVTTSAAASPDRVGITTSEGTPSSPDANSSRVGGTTEESDMDDDDEEEEPISSDDEPARGRRRKSKEGRWTKEEHSSFLEGLKLYGKSWRDIQTLVKTRTPDQIRTHAQKYFIKLGKYDGDSTTPPLTSVSPLPSDMGAAVAQRPTALEVMEAGKVMAS